MITSSAHSGFEAADIRAIFNAKNATIALGWLRETSQPYRQPAPQLASWMVDNLPQSVTVFELPEAHRRLLQPTNGLECINKEIKTRTQVATISPNEASCLRLVSAVFMEISDEWEAV